MSDGTQFDDFPLRARFAIVMFAIGMMVFALMWARERRVNERLLVEVERAKQDVGHFQAEAEHLRALMRCVDAYLDANIAYLVSTAGTQRRHNANRRDGGRGNAHPHGDRNGDR